MVDIRFKSKNLVTFNRHIIRWTIPSAATLTFVFASLIREINASNIAISLKTDSSGYLLTMSITAVNESSFCFQSNAGC